MQVIHLLSDGCLFLCIVVGRKYTMSCMQLYYYCATVSRKIGVAKAESGCFIDRVAYNQCEALKVVNM